MRGRDDKRGSVGRVARIAAALGCAVAVWVSGPGSVVDGAQVAPVQAQSTEEDEETSKEDLRPTDNMDAEEIARGIQKFYKRTEDYQATFKQVYTDVAAGEEKKTWGKVYFKKPGQMRWDYYEGAERKQRKKTLVSDGKVFWIYELEFQQVFKQCLQESKLPTSLKFLMGQGNLLADFDIEFTEASTKEAPELELTPKKPTPKYKKLHFQVDPKTLQVAKTTVFGPYGNTNTIEFAEPQLNQNLPDSGFDFEPPEGARLLNPKKDCE